MQYPSAHLEFGGHDIKEHASTHCPNLHLLPAGHCVFVVQALDTTQRPPWHTWPGGQTATEQKSTQRFK